MNLELTFRPAGPSDFDEILKLSEGIYDGVDYVPVRYQTWMKMDNVTVLLAFSGERLAGLLVGTVVDEGRTLLVRAGRTLPELRGQGVFKRLIKEGVDFMGRRYPNYCRERYVTEEKDDDPSLTKITQVGLLISHAKKKNFRLDHFSTSDNPIQLEACSKEYLCNVIFSSPLAQKLFPDNAIILGNFSIEPLRSNIDNWLQEYNAYSAVEKCSDGAFPRSVSFGVMSRRVKYVYWSVAVYTSEPVLYEAHLLHHFKRACKVIDDDFIFKLVQDEGLINHGKRVLQEQLQLEVDEEISGKVKAKLYESKLILSAKSSFKDS